MLMADQPKQEVQDASGGEERIRSLISSTGLSISAFARRSGISRQNMYNLLDVAGLGRAADSTVFRFAKAAGIDVTGLTAGQVRDKIIGRSVGSIGKTQGTSVNVHSSQTSQRITHKEVVLRKDVRGGRIAGVPVDVFDSSGWDSNVEAYSEQPVTAVPVFDLSVAAGPWTEISEVAELRDAKQIDSGYFRIRIRGDSMAPGYADGSMVEFRCLRPGRDTLGNGKDYYVQRSDGVGTFKRLVAISDDMLTFRAINRRKYPDDIPVDRADIVRMAVAIAKVELVR